MNVDCNSNINSGINLAYACYKTQFYCPLDGICNIKCDGSNACNNAQYIIPNEEDYDRLNLDCMTYSSCKYSSVKCNHEEKTILLSQLTYSSSTTSWDCEYYSCCPYAWKDTVIDCPPGVDCDVSCDGTVLTCINTLINGTSATQLTVNCTNSSSCSSSLILCPTGENTNCIIICHTYSSCKNLNISVTGDNLGNFALSCNKVPGSTSSCSNAILSLDAISIKSVTINCSMDYSCQYMSITQSSFTTIDNYFYLHVKQNSCYGINFDINGTITI